MRFWKRPSVLFASTLAMLALVMFDGPSNASKTYQGWTIDTLAVAASETTAVFDLRGAGATSVGVQANCDSLRFTIQVSLTGFDEFVSVGDTAISVTSAAIWSNISSPSQPVQINATAGTPALHWLREVKLLPPDGTITSDDFAGSLPPAPFMRIIFNNNDSASLALNIVARVMTK